MSEYTDEHGTIYTVQTGYTTGDVVVLSDDKAAWKINKQVLADASPVFRHMFAESGSSSSEIRLHDSSRSNIELFIKALQGKTGDQAPRQIEYGNGPTTIHLLRRFDCLDVARQLLYANRQDLCAENLFDAFALAASLDDPTCACRILAQGWRWYAERPLTGLSLCPDSETRPWMPEDAGRIQPIWLWSLSIACTSMKDTLEWDNQYKWKTFVGLFMTHLTRFTVESGRDLWSPVGFGFTPLSSRYYR